MEKYEQLSALFQSKNKVMKLKSTAITIQAGSIFELPVLITKPGTTARWTFYSKDYDIHFGIARVNEDFNLDYIVAITPYSPNTLQQGKIVFPKAGDYSFVWDNTYSWIRSKNVVYSVDIVFPELTLNEKVACSRAVLNDLHEMRHSISKYQSREEEEEKKLVELAICREQKLRELENIKDQIEEAKIKMQTCNQQIAVLQQQAQNEAKAINQLSLTAPFLLEGNRILSMLTGPDLLRLGCVNKLMHESTRRDPIWMYVFKNDSKENMEIVLKNAWIFKKWNALNSKVLPVKEELE